MKRNGFTMIELIFVIIILGIVSSISAESIAKIYENYLNQRGIYKASVKSETTVNQIANRLANSIPGTVIGRKDALNFESIESVPPGDDSYRIIEWIGKDIDGFQAITNNTAGSFITFLSKPPVWSGYADVDASSKDQLNTPGSKLDKANTIIGNLSKKGSTLATSAILFPEGGGVAKHLGFSGGIDEANINPIVGNTGGELINLEVKANRTIKEHYAMSWTAYAIVPENAHTLPGSDVEVFDLRLYYDYQPWEGETFLNGSNSLLAKNISVLRYKGEGNTIRIKLCQQEEIKGHIFSSCKEKAVIR